MQTPGGLAFSAMAGRPVVVGAWGRQLTTLRQKRSLSTVLRKLRQLGIDNISRSTLYQYEKGQVTAPDPVVLWGLAQIYGIDVGQLIEALARNRRHPDLAELPPPRPGPALLEPDEREVLERLRALPTQERKLFLDFIAFRSRGVPNGVPRTVAGDRARRRAVPH